MRCEHQFGRGRRVRFGGGKPERQQIVLEGLKGEETIVELCRREGISPNLYYNWSNESLEAGKRRLMGDTKREATSNEVVELRQEIRELKEIVAELTIDNRGLKKSLGGTEEDR